MKTMFEFDIFKEKEIEKVDVYNWSQAVTQPVTKE